jgi:hypothetical protein
MTFVEHQSVAAIFDIHAQDKFMELAAVMPVWAIESPDNSRAIADARQLHQLQLTIFFMQPGELLIDMCSRILLNIDEHHHCDKFYLYGISENDVDPFILTELQVREVKRTEYGCQLIRSVCTSSESGES